MKDKFKEKQDVCAAVIDSKTNEEKEVNKCRYKTMKTHTKKVITTKKNL